MIRSIVRRQLDAAERRFGASMDYMRHVASRDLGLFLKISMLQPATWHNRHLPADAFHAARLATTLHADCGECVQIEASAARQAKVPAAIVRAVLDDRVDALPEGVADAVAFARTVASGGDPDDALRARLAGRYGEAGVVELATAVATAQFYPTLKRGLGYSRSCALVRVEV
jgi:alkylhydroperoxidase family enzyme